MKNAFMISFLSMPLVILFLEDKSSCEIMLVADMVAAEAILEKDDGIEEATFGCWASPQVFFTELCWKKIEMALKEKQEALDNFIKLVIQRETDYLKN